MTYEIPVVTKAVRRTRRRRGGQPGNQNARTHGFYSKTLTPRQQEAITAVPRLDGLDQEIALLRAKIISILANDPQNYRALTLAMASLARLVNMKEGFETQRLQNLTKAVENSLRAPAAPLRRTPAEACPVPRYEEAEMEPQRLSSLYQLSKGGVRLL